METSETSETSARFSLAYFRLRFGNGLYANAPDCTCVSEGACSAREGWKGETKPRAGGTRGRVCRQRLVRRVARGIVDLSRVLSRGSRSRRLAVEPRHDPLR